MCSRSKTKAELEAYKVVRRHTQHVYENAERAFTELSKSLLTNEPNTLKWLSTVKTAVFGNSSSLPPLIDREGKLIGSADEKASLFSLHLDAKQCRD